MKSLTRIKIKLYTFFSPFGSHRHIHSLVCIFQSALQVVLRPYKYLNPLCSVVTKMASECHLHSHPGVLSELPECITNYLLQSHLTSHSTVPKHFFIFHLWAHTLDSLNSTSYWLVAPSLPTKGDINCSGNTLHALPLPYPYWCCSFISTVSPLWFFFFLSLHHWLLKSHAFHTRSRHECEILGQIIRKPFIGSALVA